MCKCCTKDIKFEIDHITALASGGINEKSNLQVLCKACHLIKTSNEHETGHYIKVSDTESTFNSQVQDVFDSPLSQTHAFVEKAYKIVKPSSFVNLNQDYNRHKILNYYCDYLKPQTLFTIDINKCRKNILYYGEFDYCVFTVFDKVEQFKGTKIKPGLYYVESDNYMPMRGNGWYYHNMIWYC
jgi:hypothetical protein